MSCINGVIPEEFPDAYLLVICETLESNKANCENIIQYRKDAICRYEYLKISKLIISLLVFIGGPVQSGRSCVKVDGPVGLDLTV